MACATCCLLIEKPPEGETTLSGWSGLALIFLSATTFSRPGMCRALRVTCLVVHQVRILHKRAHRGPDLMPPSLFMYDITVMLSVATRTILSEQRSCNSFRAKRPISILSNLYAACFLDGTKCLLQCAHLSEHPPSFYVSVKICRACFIGCNG